MGDFLQKVTFKSAIKPGFHMIITVGNASPRHARGHIGEICVQWKHFLNEVADVAHQTGTVRGRIERVEMNLEPGFHMIISVMVPIYRRLIGDTSPMYRSRSPTVTIIWKPGLTSENKNQDFSVFLPNNDNYLCYALGTTESP